jgi:hypothetical protein
MTDNPIRAALEKAVARVRDTQHASLDDAVADGIAHFLRQAGARSKQLRTLAAAVEEAARDG